MKFLQYKNRYLLLENFKLNVKTNKKYIDIIYSADIV